MIQFSDLHITPQADELVLEAEIISDNAFRKCYFKKIYIDTQDSYLSSGPSEDTVYEREITDEDANNDKPSPFVLDDNDDYKPIQNQVRKIKIKIPQIDINANLKTNLFVVYLEADGKITDQNTNCCETDYVCVGCTFHERDLYMSFLSWIREINNMCEIPKNFIYTYLQYQALFIAVRTGNMYEAIKLYNKYLRKQHCLSSNFSKCNCGK